MKYLFEKSVLIYWADCSEFQQPNGVAGHEGRQFGNHCRTMSIFAGNVRGPAVFRMDCKVLQFLLFDPNVIFVKKVWTPWACTVHVNLPKMGPYYRKPM